MSQIVNTCVIYGNLKVYYNYIKSKPLKTLNPMGNFYRFSHLHKETQRFMENYLKSGEVPNKDQEIYSETLCSKLIVTNGLFFRAPKSWRTLATRFLPVPEFPSIRTVKSVLITLAIIL